MPAASCLPAPRLRVSVASQLPPVSVISSIVVHPLIARGPPSVSA
jgi:hypothetical protein